MDAIQESIDQLQKMFTQRMDIYQGELQAAAPTANTANLNTEFAAFRDFMMTALRSLQDQVALLAQQMDSMEMRSRRKILLLHGIPEAKDEDTVAVVVKAVAEKLKLAEFSAKGVSRCHRMGRISSSDKPRPILFKLRESEMKNKIWNAKTSLKGSGITVSEFLTKARHDAFMAGRQRFGISKCWTRDGFVFVLGIDDVRHRISSIVELDKINCPELATQVRSETTVKETQAAPRTRRTVRK